MKKIIVLALALAAPVILAPGTAAADCPDREGIACPTGNIGWQGQCNRPSPTHPFNCEACGDAHCPPAAWNRVPYGVNSTCEKKIVESKRMDGCSTIHTSLPLFDQYAAVFKASCDQHDFCYHVSEVTKATCDENFHKNMVATCEHFLTGKTTAFKQSGIAMAGCLATARTWFAAVAASGVTPWVKGFDSDRQWAREHCGK